MAIRTTSEKVEGIIEVDTNIDLLPFIETASVMVDDCCSSVTTYDANRLELIERWLAAHFYAIRDPRKASEDYGFVGLSYEYQFKIGLNLAQTSYGQQAMFLDTAGGLASANAKSASSVSGSSVRNVIGVTHLKEEDE